MNTFIVCSQTDGIPLKFDEARTHATTALNYSALFTGLVELTLATFTRCEGIAPSPPAPRLLVPRTRIPVQDRITPKDSDVTHDPVQGDEAMGTVSAEHRCTAAQKGSDNGGTGSSFITIELRTAKGVYMVVTSDGDLTLVAAVA